ncbi:class II glutamine amidotransferase [Chthonobacter rhizosphaerae]|uniref:class II glutamine amidotransferase n=1 Tax=Chthonobacter rhizosphaerae TaxID=2735553 RepID=UPI0015EEEB6F|nr:glutamine amidotransferase family protein [Chthonobacter rhizosphaerae]
MCGIVGIFIKDPALEPELGKHLAAMLEVMTDRGPDSAGFAVYGAGSADTTKVTVRLAAGASADAVVSGLSEALGEPVSSTVRGSHVVLSLPADRLEDGLTALGRIAPDATVASIGSRMEVYKEVGLPADVAKAFGLASMSGTHGIGHTRMATESAVTTDGAHPYSTGSDQCLVHNGSLSNHNQVRRRLIREGITFRTENDTEVAAGYLSWRLRQGDKLDDALRASLDDLDGFYTFVVGTDTGFGVLRDAIGCKPAVMAETDQYVAFGSEYRALSVLPGIEKARVFEPDPATVYFWDRAE